MAENTIPQIGHLIDGRMSAADLRELHDPGKLDDVAATAQKVIEGTVSTIKNVTLELGGNDPAIVLDDADIDATLERMLTGAYTRSGQICFAIKRIYVPRGMYARFADAFCERVDQYAVGHGLDPRVQLRAAQQRGPVQEGSRPARPHPQLVGAARPARPQGRRVLVGQRLLRAAARRPRCRAHRAGLLRGAVRAGRPAHRLRRRGPGRGLGERQRLRAGVVGVDQRRRARAGDGPPDRGGSTFVNTHSFASLDLRMPFGGIKQSGIGREFGTAGLAPYVEEHSIRYLK